MKVFARIFLILLIANFFSPAVIFAVDTNSTYTGSLDTNTANFGEGADKSFQTGVSQTQQSSDLNPKPLNLQTTTPKPTTSLQQPSVTSQPTQQTNTQSKSSGGTNSAYTPLQPVKLPNGKDLYGGASITDYLKTIYSFGIAIAGALAVIMIVLAGIRYMLDEAFTSKAEAIKQIQAAFTGLLIALSSYVLLYTINPELVKLNFNLKPLTAPSSNGLDPTQLTLGGPIDTSLGAGIGGSISSNSLKGTSFPSVSGLSDSEVETMVLNSGIASLPLSEEDRAKYFPNGEVTASGYRSLLASIANSESGFNPNDNTTAHRKDGSSSFSSEGLFSLSVGDSAVNNLASKYGISAQEVINNPKYNTEAAINILKNQVQSKGSISGGSTTGYWGPLRRGE